MAGIRRALLAVAHRPDLAAVGSEPDEVLAHRFGAALPQGDVVLGGAALVAVTRHRHRRIAAIPQALPIGLERRAPLGGQAGVVESEVDRLQLAGLRGAAAVL